MRSRNIAVNGAASGPPNVLAQVRGAGLPAERPSGAAGWALA